MTGRFRAVLLLSALLLAGLVLVPTSGLVRPASVTSAAAPASPVELVYRGDDRIARLRIAVELDGQPLEVFWDETFRKLFADLDRDGDGFLSREEALRAPSALRVRQLSWGLFFAAPAPAPWEELDHNPTDGKVSFDEFADYYRRHLVGGVQVAVGRAPATDALTDALLHTLDRDHDGGVSKAEWLAAADSLHAIDLNDDELVSGDELVPGLNYPGALGGTLLTPPSPDDPPSSLLDSFPFLRLPEYADANGARPLIVQHDKPPDFALVVRLGRRAKGVAPVEWLGRTADADVLLQIGRTLCALRTGESGLAAEFASARKLALERFVEADAYHKGCLDRGEAGRSPFAPLRDLFDTADRNGDGKVSAAEWSAYLDLQARLIEGQVVLTILDHGRGLFELLDADRDGVLSVRELRSAWTRRPAVCATGRWTARSCRGLLGDGSVRFLKQDIDVYVLYGLATRSGGEMLANTDY